VQHFVCHRRREPVLLLHSAKPIFCGSSNNRAQRFSRPPALSSRGQPAGLLHQVPPGEERCLTNSTGTPYSKNFVQSPKTRLEPSHQLAKPCLLVCHTLCSGNLTADVCGCTQARELPSSLHSDQRISKLLSNVAHLLRTESNEVG